MIMSIFEAQILVEKKVYERFCDDLRDMSTSVTYWVVVGHNQVVFCDGYDVAVRSGAGYYVFSIENRHGLKITLHG